MAAILRHGAATVTPPAGRPDGAGGVRPSRRLWRSAPRCALIAAMTPPSAGSRRPLSAASRWSGATRARASPSRCRGSPRSSPARGHAVVLDAETARSTPLAGLSDGAAPTRWATRADVAIVVGGDGTMLAIARQLAPLDVPLIGVNQGRLGLPHRHPARGDGGVARRRCSTAATSRSAARCSRPTVARADGDAARPRSR